MTLLNKLKKELKGSGLIVLDWTKYNYTISLKGYQGAGSAPSIAEVDKVTGVVSNITDDFGRFDIVYNLQQLISK